MGKRDDISSFGELLSLLPDMPANANQAATLMPEGPFLITSVAWAKKAPALLQAEIDTFKPIYDTSELKAKTGRGQRAIKDNTLRDNMVADITVLLPKDFDMKLPDDHEHAATLKAAMQPVMTALAQGRKDIRVEKDAIACIKVTLQGTREVVAAPITNIIACMRNEGVEENNIDLNGLYTYIGAIDRKKLEAYQSKGL